jgi:hypothetical protein
MPQQIAQSFSISSFEDYISLLCSFSPNQAICIHGETGVGKSESVTQIARRLRSDFYKSQENCELVTACLKTNPLFAEELKLNKAECWKYEFGIPVIMRRLSQLTEGDVTGIPYKKDVALGAYKRVSSQFLQTDWLLDARDFPCVLFLDERNRALEGVKQAVFELQDSKSFYGHKLHEDTRIYVAENVGDQYNVQQLEPAEISRVALIFLNPDVKSWISWAEKNNVNELIIDFINYNNDLLEHKGTYEPGKKYPDRRAWTRLSKELEQAKMFDNIKETRFYQMAAMMIGPEIAIKFWDFCKDRERETSAEEIAQSWEKVKKRITRNDIIPTKIYIGLCYKLTKWLSGPDAPILTEDQAKQIGNFMREVPAELKMDIWVACNSNKKNLFTMQKYCVQILMDTCNSPAVNSVQKEK